MARGRIFASTLMLLACAFTAQAEEPLRLYYYERPPFHFTDENGVVVGSIAQVAEQTLLRAGVPFAWERLPANRILKALGREAACSPGWYSTPQRRKQLRFSVPMLRDKPLIGLMRADFPVEPGITAKAFFGLARVRLLAKQNFSQGAYMDALIARMPAEQVQRVALEVPQMARMLRANRADVIVTTEDEARLFIDSAGPDSHEFRIVRFPDVPAEEMRYIVCGQAVAPALLARINHAIAFRP